MTNNRSQTPSGFTPLESSGRIPLETAPINRGVKSSKPTKSVLRNFFFCKAALRYYLITLLILNLVVGATILGSLQQLYRTINNLTESVAVLSINDRYNNDIVEPVKKQEKGK
jgi:hypothetical protein